MFLTGEGAILGGALAVVVLAVVSAVTLLRMLFGHRAEVKGGSGNLASGGAGFRSMSLPGGTRHLV